MNKAEAKTCYGHINWWIKIVKAWGNKRKRSLGWNLPSREHPPSPPGWHIGRWWALPAQSCRSWWSQNWAPVFFWSKKIVLEISFLVNQVEQTDENLPHLPIFSADLPLIAVKCSTTRSGDQKVQHSVHCPNVFLVLPLKIVTFSLLKVCFHHPRLFF